MERTYLGRKQHINLFLSSHLTKNSHYKRNLSRGSALLLLLIQLLPWPALWDRAIREGRGISLPMNASLLVSKQWSNNPTEGMFSLNVYQKQTDQMKTAYHPALHLYHTPALAGCPRTQGQKTHCTFQVILPGNSPG